MKKILIALTNTPTYGERNDATGLWLGEAAEFVDEVAQCCFEVDYVSPKGGYVPLDPRSMKKAYADRATFALYRSEDFQTRALARSLQSPRRNEPSRLCRAVLHGRSRRDVGLPRQRRAAAFGLSIYDQGGYVASVCHGIAGLLYLSGERGVRGGCGKKHHGLHHCGRASERQERRDPLLEREGGQGPPCDLP